MRHPTLSLLILVLAVVGCARIGPSGEGDESPGPSATDQPMAEPSVEPSLISNLPLPSGMVLPPIVDPDGPGPPYGRGEAVELGAVVIVYEGTSTTSDGYVAAFQIMGDLPQSVSGLFFLPGGPSVPLAVDGDRATSEPFHLRGTPRPTTLFSWRVGSDTVVWELGPIESR